MSREALLWSGGCSVTHGDSFSSSGVCGTSWGRAGTGLPAAALKMGTGSRSLPVQPSRRWYLGTGQTVRTSTASTPSGATLTAVTCSRCPGEPKFSFGHGQDQRHQGGEWGLPAQGAPAVSHKCHFLFGLNDNAADSCSHTQTPSPLPWFSVHFLLSQGLARVQKVTTNPQDQRGTQVSKAIILKAITVAFSYTEHPKKYRIIELQNHLS